MGNCASKRRPYDRIRALEDRNTTLGYDNTSKDQTISCLRQGIEANTRSREEQSRAYAVLERQHHDLQAKAAAEGDRLQVEVTKLQDSLTLVQDGLATGSEALRVAEQELDRAKQELALSHYQYHATTNDLRTRLSQAEQQRTELNAAFEWEKETSQHLLLGAEISALAEAEAIRSELKLATTRLDELSSETHIGVVAISGLPLYQSQANQLLDAMREIGRWRSECSRMRVTLGQRISDMRKSSKALDIAKAESMAAKQALSVATSERDNAVKEKQNISALLELSTKDLAEAKAHSTTARQALSDAISERDYALKEAQCTSDRLESWKLASGELERDMTAFKAASMRAREVAEAISVDEPIASSTHDFSREIPFSQDRVDDLYLYVDTHYSNARIRIGECDHRGSVVGVAMFVKEAEQLAKLLPKAVHFAKMHPA